MKFEQYQLEIQYILKVFRAVHKKFLTAIGHIDYLPLQKHNANATRMKGSEVYNPIWALSYPNLNINPF